jgi:G3E family GTPase
MPMVPVFLLSGFLGSGKTTLLNRLLEHPAFTNTAVIVNEFGEIGLDHLLIAQGSDNVVLLEGGCLCCTIADSLHETLADLNFRKVRGEIPAFERVIIETTGLADPAPILNTLLGHRLVTDHYRLEAVIVAVDALHALANISDAPEVALQIAVADRLIITKCDIAPMPAALLSQLDTINPNASRFDSQQAGALTAAFAPGDRYRLPRRYQTVAPGDVAQRSRMHGADSSSRIRADGFVLPHPPTWAGIAAWWSVASGEFGDRLLRCKGVLEIADTGEIVFVQGVQRVFHAPERLPGWPDADRRSRLVCITRDVEAALLQRTLRAFDAAAGTPPPLKLSDLPLENLQ